MSKPLCVGRYAVMISIYDNTTSLEVFEDAFDTDSEIGVKLALERAQDALDRYATYKQKETP